ncbi:hypothetical protein D3C78_973800 [compost metagenome]
MVDHAVRLQALAQATGAVAGEGLQVSGKRGHAGEQTVQARQAGLHRCAVTLGEQQAEAAQLHAHGGQRLVDLVGQRGGHLPQRGHLGGLHQLVLGLAQFGGAFLDQALQLGARTLAQAAVVVALDQEQQQKSQRQPGAACGQAVAAHRAAGRAGVVQQVQGPVVLDQRLAQPQVVAATVRAIDPLQLGRLVERLQRLQDQRVQGLAGVLAGVRRLHRLLARAALQVAEAPGRAVGEDHHAVAVGDQQGARLADPAALQLLHLQLEHHHAARRAAFVAHQPGEEVAGHPGGHADREVAATAQAQGVLEVGAEGIVVADEAGRVVPVAGGDGLAAGVEQVEHRRAGLGVEALQAQVELLAALWIGAGAQGGEHLAVVGDDRRHGAVALDQDAQRLRVQFQLAARLDAALVPLARLGGPPGQPDAEAEADEDQQQDEDDALAGGGRRHVHSSPASRR